MDAGPIGDAAATRDPRRTAYRRITLRLMPLVVLSYCCAYVDRVNVGFAKLRMLSDLHFSDLTYGFGAGIFFIGYFLFEIPSNLLLQRYGARVVLATIMVVWSVISAATSLVHTPAQFYVARLLLGLAEAGLSPGIMLYLTYWFPPARRGFALGAYYVGVPLAGIVGGPLSGMILKAFAGSTGFRDWQWLFVLEAIPSLLVGLVLLGFATSRPEQAHWLSDAERRAVQEDLAAGASPYEVHAGLRTFLLDGRMWRLASVYFCELVGLYGLSFWLPSVIRASGIRDVATIGWVSAVPYLVAMPVIVLSGITADRTGLRRLHFAGFLLVGAVAFALSGLSSLGPAGAVALLSVATVGILSALSLFWGVPATLLAGTSAAVGIALINAIGNLAGMMSPWMVGWLNVHTGGQQAGLVAVAAFMALGALLVWTVPGSQERLRTRKEIR